MAYRKKKSSIGFSGGRPAPDWWPAPPPSVEVRALRDEVTELRTLAATAIRGMELLTEHMEHLPVETGGQKEMTDAHALYGALIDQLVAAKERYALDRARAAADEARYLAELIAVYKALPSAMRDLNSAVASKATDMSASAVVATIRPFTDLVNGIQTMLAEMRAEAAVQRQSVQSVLETMRELHAAIVELRQERREAGADLQRQINELRGKP